MASARYQYPPLSSNASFRLFRLKKTPNVVASSEPLEIELFEAPLFKAPAFEAVFYAWGKSSAPSSIVCNGLRLDVSPIVVDLIFGLLRVGAPDLLWIDSICIDQASMLDKSSQVPHMRTIYSTADKVWIWLGEGTFESVVSFDFLSELAKIWQQYECSAFFDTDSEIWSDYVQGYKGVAIEVADFEHWG